MNRWKMVALFAGFMLLGTAAPASADRACEWQCQQKYKKWYQKVNRWGCIAKCRVQDRIKKPARAGTVSSCPGWKCTIPGQVCTSGPGYVCQNRPNKAKGCFGGPCWFAKGQTSSETAATPKSGWSLNQCRDRCASRYSFGSERSRCYTHCQGQSEAKAMSQTDRVNAELSRGKAEVDAMRNTPCGRSCAARYPGNTFMKRAQRNLCMRRCQQTSPPPAVKGSAKKCKERCWMKHWGNQSAQQSCMKTCGRYTAGDQGAITLYHQAMAALTAAKTRRPGRAGYMHDIEGKRARLKMYLQQGYYDDLKKAAQQVLREWRQSVSAQRYVGE